MTLLLIVTSAMSIKVQAVSTATSTQSVSNVSASKPKADKKNKADKKSTNGAALAEDEIVLKTTGDGDSTEAAVKDALRKAIEETYGVFVSSNTSILNDEIVKDEIATVSSGNIRNYKIISEFRFGEKVNVTVESIVSIGKLLTFAKNHGSEAELEGENLSANMQLSELKQKETEIALNNLKRQIDLSIANLPLYNYELSIGEPNTTDPNMVTVPIEITITQNGNLETLIESAKSVVKSLSVSREVAASEENISNFYPIYLGYQTVDTPSWGTETSAEKAFRKYCYWYLGSPWFYGDGCDIDLEKPLNPEILRFDNYKNLDIENVFFLRSLLFFANYPDARGGDNRHRVETIDTYINPDILLQAYNFIISDGINQYKVFPIIESHQGGQSDTYSLEFICENPNEGILMLPHSNVHKPSIQDDKISLRANLIYDKNVIKEIGKINIMPYSEKMEFSEGKIRMQKGLTEEFAKFIEKINSYKR